MYYKNLDDAIGNFKIEGNYFSASWPAPSLVKTMITTRLGGFSYPPYNSLNLAYHVDDNPLLVQQNRDYIQSHIPVPIIYLNQIHSNIVLPAQINMQDKPMTADALYSDNNQLACAILTADCLPILICNTMGTKIAAIHAGWKGIAGGIIQNTLQKLQEPAQELMVYFGPAISQYAFEVRQDMVSVFLNPQLQHYQLKSCFEAISEETYLANIYAIARKILEYHGVTQIYGGEYCTVLQNKYFYSYRKEHQTGRIASIIWLE